jgi:uncharacterized DUF497 family protein
MSATPLAPGIEILGYRRPATVDYGEQRFVTFGTLEGRVLAVVHTETDDEIQMISMRKATRREEQSYFATISE